MSVQTFHLPDPGEGLTEAEILTWQVAVGDDVQVNQMLVEVETAKAAVELPSPFAGRVAELLVRPGESVAVGAPIIRIDTDATGDVDGPPAVPGAAGESGAKIGETLPDGRIATLVGYVAAGSGATRRPRRSANGGLPAVPPDHDRPEAPKAAPPVRKLAKELGVDLAALTPARADGVISRSEVEAAGKPATAARGDGERRPDASTGARERRIAVKGVRKLMAQAMVASKFTAPHVTEFLTVDVTPLIELRERCQRRPEFAGLKLTPLAFTARAVCLAARRTPEINSTWSGDTGEIVVKEYVHLGIAAATPRGLVVPVLRDADRMDLVGLARGLSELTETARAGHSLPADLTGSTFTITNVGVFGIDTGTPIINPGESAILALGAIKPAPWVVDGALAVRQVCQLALSFDHRVIDGAQGSTFLADVGALLSDPGLALAL